MFYKVIKIVVDWEHASGKLFFVTKCILFVCRESRNILVNTESVKCETDVTGKVY